MVEHAGTSGSRPGPQSRPAGFGGPDRIPRPPALRPGAPAVALTPKEIFGMLRRHVLLMVSMTILGFIGGGVAWFLLLRYSPKYTAVTYIEVLPPVESDPMRIGTQLPNKDIVYQFRVSMATLIKQQSTLQKLLRNDKIRATQWYKSLESDIDQIEDLQDNFRAAPERESQYIRVSMTCGGKKESALIVNEMVGLFLHSRADSTTGEISGKLRELRAQEAKIQKDLKMAEDQLRQVSEVSDLAMLGEDLWRHPITVKLTNWELKKDELLTEISQLEFTLIALEERLKGPLTLIDRRQVEVDPIMLALANKLAALGSDLARKRQYLGEEHRIIRQTREIIRQTKQERVQRRLEIGEMERRSNYKSAQDALTIFKSQLDMLENNRKETEKEQKRLNAVQAHYEQLLDIRDQTRDQLDRMRQLIASYETVLNDPRTPKVRLVGPAPEPLRVSSPKWQLYMPGGTVLGFMLGVGLVFLIELLNDLVRTPSDVSRHLHIPLLAVICHAEEDADVDEVDLCHVVRQAPYSIVSECYRRLRANLKLCNSPEAFKTLLVTSASAGDGKTSTAVNLAATFVAEDKSVLLIDTNFRRPRSIALFPKPQSPEKDQAQDGSDFGLSNFLTTQCSYEDVIRPSGVNGLDIIDCGPLPSNPAELLGNARMKLLTQQQREKYDHIIIDGPPVLLVSEAKVLSSQVDSVILVLNAGTTRRGVAQRTIRELRETGANIVGCVLFGARAMKGGYFREMFKSYREYQKPQLAGAIQ